MPPRPKAASAVPAPKGAGQKAALPGLAPVFFALGDETRLRIIAALCAGGVFSIAQLTAGTDITRQAVTKHLLVLSDAGLVKDLKIGRERLWQFDPARLDEARRSLEIIGRQWESALMKLKISLES